MMRVSFPLSELVPSGSGNTLGFPLNSPSCIRIELWLLEGKNLPLTSITSSPLCTVGFISRLVKGCGVTDACKYLMEAWQRRTSQAPKCSTNHIAGASESSDSPAKERLLRHQAEQHRRFQREQLLRHQQQPSLRHPFPRVR